MNTYNNHDHYTALMTLCADPAGSFYFTDQMWGGVLYRIFNYRLASYTEFLKPYARECRGAMFEVDIDGNMIRLASLPMHKFFNLNENPLTMDLNVTVLDSIMVKEDGSLISTYAHKGNVLMLKTKGSVKSEQVVMAETYLNDASMKNFRNFLYTMTLDNNYTVNMEFTSPRNRIVVPYQEDRLTVLNVRNNATGEYLTYATIKALMDRYNCGEYLVVNLVDNIEVPEDFVSAIPGMKQGEGYVCVQPNGEWFKVKNDAYVSLHRLKDSVNSPRALFGVVVNEVSDDFKAAFPEDFYMLEKIAEMEEIVRKVYADIQHKALDFVKENKHLDRKSFAILGQQEVPRMYFGIAMSEYLGKSVNLKEFLIKNCREWIGAEPDKALASQE